MYPLKRATAVGRSLSTPAAGQPVTIPPDAVRGTLFGHSIHLPDVNAPDAADVELSSGAVQFLDGSPPASQPFPLADSTRGRRSRRRRRRPAARFRHALRRRLAHAAGRSAQRSKTFERFLALRRRPVDRRRGCLGAGGNTAAVAMPRRTNAAGRGRAGRDAARRSTRCRRRGAARPLPAPAPTPTRGRARPPSRRARPGSGPGGSPGCQRPRRRPAPAAAPADEPRPASPSATAARTPARHAAPRDERHAAAKPTPPPDDAAPAEASKPGHAHKRPAVQEDPDATMAPSE